MTQHRTTTHWGTFEVSVEGGRPVGASALPDDPEGVELADGLHEVLDHRTRIRRPHVRRSWLEGGPKQGGNTRGGDEFVEVDWDEAYDLVAGELTRVRRDHGDESVYGGSYGWSSAGRFHHAQSQIHRFLASDGGYTSSRNSYSVGAHEVVLPHVIGGGGMAMFDWNPQWDEIADQGGLVVAFGGAPLKNTQVNPGGLLRHRAGDAQRACAEAGVEFVCVSPVKDDLDPSLHADWVSLRPGTDVAVMLALMHCLIDSGTVDRDFVDRCCTGYAELEAYVLGTTDRVPKTAAWASAISDVPVDVIESLAQRIVAQRTVISVTWSLQRAQHGEQPYWAAVSLAAMSGSMGKPGGGFAAGLGATHGIGLHRGSMQAASLSQGHNRVGTFIPVARIADMLLSPGATIDYDGGTVTYPDVRLVYWAGGNPFHHHQDLNKLLAAWNVPETVVVHDSWWTPIARHADIVIPVATTMERDDLAAGQRDTVLIPMRRVVDPPDGVPTDFEAFCEIASRRGHLDAFGEGLDADQWVARLYAETADRARGRGLDLPDAADFWTSEGVEMPLVEQTLPPFEALRKDPAAHPLTTPSGKVELFSSTVAGFGYEECPGHASWQEPDEWLGADDTPRDGLHLLTHQPKGKLHSQLDFSRSSQRHKSGGRERVTLHPATAEGLGIDEGDVVRVFNDRGACLAVARLTDAVHPRVALMSTGGWWDPEVPGAIGSTCLQGNPNVLTLDVPTSRLAQATSAQTCIVRVRREDGAADSRAHWPPPVVGRDGAQSPRRRGPTASTGSRPAAAAP